MGKTKNILANEQGSAIILAVLILAVLTILGVSSTNTSTVELQIVRNERIYQQNFYKAESAVMEAAQRLELENDKANLRPAAKVWLVDVDTHLEKITDFLDHDNASLIDAVNASYSANARGIVSGASLDMTSEHNMYGFKIFGYSRDNQGNVFIEVGYKKRM